MTTDLTPQALLMAVWRRKPDGKVTVHSDQGSQFTGREWQTFLREHGLEPSMSRRGNCHEFKPVRAADRLIRGINRMRRTLWPRASSSY